MLKAHLRTPVTELVFRVCPSVLELISSVKEGIDAGIAIDGGVHTTAGHRAGNSKGVAVVDKVVDAAPEKAKLSFSYGFFSLISIDLAGAEDILPFGNAVADAFTLVELAAGEYVYLVCASIYVLT